MNILDNIKSLLFYFHTFGVRRTIYVLDSENQPGSGKIRTGSGALGLTGDVWHQKYKNKKGGVKSYLTYSFNRLLKISLSLRYNDPDPVFGQNRILIPGKMTTILFFVTPFNYLAGYPAGVRISGQFSIRFNPNLANKIIKYLAILPIFPKKHGDMLL